MALTGAWAPRLGLDLSGGTSITLTAAPVSGQGEVTPSQLDEAVSIIRNRVGDITEAEVTTQGGENIVVAVPGVNQDEIVKRVGTTAQMRFRQVLAQTAATATTPSPTPSPTPTATSTPAPTDGPEPTGTSTPTGDPTESPTASPNPQDTATPPPSPAPAGAGPAPAHVLRDGAEDAESAEDTPSPTSSPESSQPPSPETSEPAPENAEQDGGSKAATGDITVNTTGPTAEQQQQLAAFQCDDYDPSADDPDRTLLACDESGAVKYLLGPALVLGSQIGDAYPALPQNDISWVVSLELEGQGTENFAEASEQMVNLSQPLSQFAIVLDGEVVSAPVMQAAIRDGKAQISGQFTQESAAELANVLRYGALPLSFDTSSVETVSPTLGSDQLTGGLLAGAIGLLLVVVYSFFYYRGLGLVVVLSLIVAAAMTYEAATLLSAAQGFTLTLAGVAGLIVAIGITADSFVVYFERLRDEVRDGKGLRFAVESGWRRARRTILAADSVSLLAATVLYVLSVGNVRGFAYALGLTTVIDLIVVLVFTKPLVTMLARTRFFGQGHRLSGLNPERLGVRAKPTGPARTGSGRRTAAATRGA